METAADTDTPLQRIPLDSNKHSSPTSGAEYQADALADSENYRCFGTDSDDAEGPGDGTPAARQQAASALADEGTLPPALLAGDNASPGGEGEGNSPVRQPESAAASPQQNAGYIPLIEADHEEIELDYSEVRGCDTPS